MSKSLLRKIPVIDLSKCICCDKCKDACPTGVIQKETRDACNKCIKYCMTLQVPCNPANYVFKYGKCDACGLCITVCVEHAVYWVNSKKSEMFSLSHK